MFGDGQTIKTPKALGLVGEIVEVDMRNAAVRESRLVKVDGYEFDNHPYRRANNIYTTHGRRVVYLCSPYGHWLPVSDSPKHMFVGERLPDIITITEVAPGEYAIPPEPDDNVEFTTQMWVVNDNGERLYQV